MTEGLSLRGGSRQENVEPKTSYLVDEKLRIQDVTASPYNAEAYEGSWGDTQHDIRDMQRLGKKQEFKASPLPNAIGTAIDDYLCSVISASGLLWALCPYTWPPGSLSLCMFKVSIAG